MTKQLPVTVLSGFLGSGKTTLLKRILENTQGRKIAVIVNDMAEINIDASLVKKTDEKLVSMSNGCICCTLREDLLIEIQNLVKENAYDYLVIESSGISEPLPIAETFTFEQEDGTSLSKVAKLDTMVTIIDASTFMDTIGSLETLKDRKQEVSDEDERTITDLLVDQVEFANVIILNKIDTVDEQTKKDIHGMLRALNTDANIIETTYAQVPLDSIIDTNLFSFEKASESPGWLKEMRGEHIPETEEYEISSMVFKARKPFHPQRFWEFGNQQQQSILRAKGYCWMAHDHDMAWFYEQAGRQNKTGPMGYWIATLDKKEWDEEMKQTAQETWQEPYGDRRQEVVFIGQRLDKQALQQELEACLLTDEEFEKGPEFWKTLPNPFPKMEEDVQESSAQ